MNRKPLIAIAAFAVLGLIAVFSLRQPEKGDSAAEHQRPLGKIDATALDTLEITRGGVKAAIKRDGGKYSVTAPVAYAGDESAIKSAFEQVEKLELGDLVTENKAKQAEFELDDAKAIHVVAKSAKGGDKVLADFLVGKIVGLGTMVRLAGKDPIWQASSGVRAAFDHPAADWRDRGITTFRSDDAETLTVKAKDGTEAVVKRVGAASEDKWELVSSVPKLGPADKLDKTVPSGIVSTLSSWKTNDFADGVAPAASGLDAPSLTITVALKGGKTVTVLVGGKKGEEDFYVKSADAPQVFLVKKFNIERVAKRPVEFKDKTLCDLAEADLAEIAVTNGADSYTLAHAGGAWKATKPAKLELDPARTPTLGAAFKDWKATGIAEETPAAAGLAKPRATVSAKATKGAPCSVKVGDETKDKQSVFVQSTKGPDVYLAPKWSLDRLLVKVDDLKKK
jgi:Domain of unknown function (DUF4340)